jgi:hypothetical protein
MIYPLRITAKYNGEAEKPWLVPSLRYVIDVQPHPIFKDEGRFQVTIAAIEYPQAYHSKETAAKIIAAERSFPLGVLGYSYDSNQSFNSAWIELLSWGNEPLSQQELEMLPKR